MTCMALRRVIETTNYFQLFVTVAGILIYADSMMDCNYWHWFFCNTFSSPSKNNTPHIFRIEGSVRQVNDFLKGTLKTLQGHSETTYENIRLH